MTGGPRASEVSAGGVVLRGDDVVVVVPRGRSTLVLPKGGLEPGETIQEAARREVREEAGVEAELVCELGEARYTYSRGGRSRDKIVHFFLFRYLSGDTADHDHEVSDARWIPLREAGTALSFPAERQMIHRALLLAGLDR